MTMNQVIIRISLLLLLAGTAPFVGAAQQPVQQDKQKARVPGPGKEFQQIIASYSNRATAKKYWKELVSLYSGADRHYHNLEHLNNFYHQLMLCQTQVKDWESLVVAMVYHDAIYNSSDRKDEERSAELAISRLNEIGFPQEKIHMISTLILATKTHAGSSNDDVNYFNDADMSILGLDRDTYIRYTKNVRLEYAATPNFDAGRRKVLNYFLSMQQIFKTAFFSSRYEAAARANIAWEITTLPISE
jgi:predicted metal-dependent HD superfamily phosphohydrolase